MQLISQHSTPYTLPKAVNEHVHIFLKIAEYSRVALSRHQGKSIVIYNSQAVAPRQGR